MIFLRGVGIVMGLVFGAGMFALPFTIARAGIFWGAVHLAVALVLTLFLLFLYTEIAYFTKGRHRFTGYAGLILGEKARMFSFFVVILSYYGSLLVYGVLGGIFLSNIFPDISPAAFTLLFFIFGSLLIIEKLENLALVNFYLTVPLVGFVCFLFIKAWPLLKLANFFPAGLNSLSLNSSWFLPYGVWLFSLSGLAAIPEAREICFSSSLKTLKKIIAFSILLSVFLYCLFIFSITGVSGAGTTADAFGGVAGILGAQVVLLGSIMGFLAVFTSFLVLAFDLKETFHYDFKISKWPAWLLASGPPVLLFCLGLQDFVLVLGLVGAVGLGVAGILVILMAQKMRAAGVIPSVKISKIVEIGAISALLLAVFYEIWTVFVA